MERARRACSWQSISDPTWAPSQATCVGAASKATPPELVGPGRSWPVLAAPGRSGPLLPVPGCSRPLRVAPGRSWPVLAAPGCSWLLLAVPGCSGPVLAVPRRSRPLPAAPGNSWPPPATVRPRTPKVADKHRGCRLWGRQSLVFSRLRPPKLSAGIEDAGSRPTKLTCFRGFWGVRPPKLPTGIEDAASRVAKATCFWGGPDGKAGNGTRALEEAASGARQSHVFSVVLEGPAHKVADRRRGCGL